MRIKQLALGIGLVLAPLIGVCQAAQWLESDQAVHALFRSATPRSSGDFLRIADSLAARAPGSCTDQYVEQVMRLNGWVLDADDLPQDWLAQTQPQPECEDACARHAFLQGALHYRVQAWDQAVNAFKKAASLPSDSTFKHEALNNLSAAFDKRGDPADSVYFALEQALRYANKRQSPYILNNLAALEISRKNWKRAQQFIDRILTESGQLEVNLLFNVNLNHLSIALESRNLGLARNLMLGLDTLEVTPGNDCTYIRLISRYYLLENDLPGFREMYPTLQSRAFNCEVSDEGWQFERLLYQPLRSEVSRNDTLNEAVSHEAWSIIRWLQDHERISLPAPLPVKAEMGPTVKSTERPSPAWWMVLAAVAIAFGGWFWQRKRAQTKKEEAYLVTRKRIRKGLNEIRERLQTSHSAADLMQAIDRLEAEWLEQPASSTIQRAQPELDMSPIEEEVLHLLAHGRSSKEIAQILDLSVSYVYNIRGRLRKKLEVPDGVDFDDWIAKRFGIE